MTGHLFSVPHVEMRTVRASYVVFCNKNIIVNVCMKNGTASDIC